MFAVSMQIMWLHFVYFIMVILLGPVIFVSHTFTHVSTSISLFALTSLPFYKPCPPPNETRNEEELGVMFSLRIKNSLTKTPPNTAIQDLVHPNAIQYTENIEQILIIDSPPMLRVRTEVEKNR